VCAKGLEYKRISLRAQSGYVFSEVEFASFGTPSGTCLSYQADSTCDSSNSTAVVAALSLGQSSCSLEVASSVFGRDPCPGLSKMLLVQLRSSIIPGTLAFLPTLLIIGWTDSLTLSPL